MNNDKKFESKDELEGWLKSRGIDDDDAVEAADKLFAKGFNRPSALLGITVEELKSDAGIQNPLARILSNKLSQQQLLSANAQAGLELMAEEYLAKKRTIVLSDATGTARIDLMDMLNLPEKGASWPNKPALSKKVDGHSWLEGDEDTVENRTAYMAYLNKILQIPADCALADTQPDRKLLTVELLRGTQRSRRISGTTDVAIAKSEHVRNNAIRNNIEALLELKKPQNLQRKDHTPQTIGEHFAASYLNPEHAVVSVLTDLNEKWTFFWFARAEDDSKGALYKLCLDGDGAAADATYLLDSLYNKSFGYSLPTTFANRISFQAILDSLDQCKRARREFGGDDSSPPEQDSKPSPSGGADQRPPSGSSSRGGDTGHKNNQGAGGAPVNMASTLSLFAPPSERDVANELDLLDMMEESEQYEIVRSFAAKHIVPYMTG